jgi:hypothetical protein
MYTVAAIVLFTLFLVGVVIMIAVYHRLKIKRYIQFHGVESLN